MKPVQLYNPADVRQTREQLYKDQQGVDALTGLPLALKDAVLDHNHKTMFVRGVIHRQANAVLGKIENLWTRYLSFWYTGTLSEFLRKCADYIERPDNLHYVHPGWLKFVQTRFNKQNESGKQSILHSMGLVQGNNGAERKEIFRKGLLTRKFSFDTIKKLVG